MRQPVLAVIAGLVAVSACSPAPSLSLSVSSPAPPADTALCATPRRVVAGIDVTGSYGAAATGRDRVARVVEEEACPGDTFFLRAVTDDSYPRAAHILTAAFPELPPAPTPPTNNNPIHERRHQQAQDAWRQLRAHHRQEAARVAQALRDAAREEAAATDLYPFFQKAAEIFAQGPAGEEHVVLLASDMEDTRGREAPVDLSGVTVIVLAYEAEDPVVAQQTRAHWREWLQQAQAARVSFIDLTEPASSVLTAHQ